MCVCVVVAVGVGAVVLSLTTTTGRELRYRLERPGLPKDAPTARLAGWLACLLCKRLSLTVSRSTANGTPGRAQHYHCGGKLFWCLIPRAWYLTRRFRLAVLAANGNPIWPGGEPGGEPGGGAILFAAQLPGDCYSAVVPQQTIGVADLPAGRFWGPQQPVR